MMFRTFGLALLSSDTESPLQLAAWYHTTGSSFTVVSIAPEQGMDAVLNNLLLVFGTIGAFLSFRFVTSTQRPFLRGVDMFARGWGRVGRWFVLVAFGAIFADTAVSRISILIGRMYYLLHDWLQVVK